MMQTWEEESRPVSYSVWGLNDCGQLLNNEEKIIRRPAVLQCDQGIFGFIGGDFHTLIVSDDLKLYSAGMNIYGQLGIPASSLKEGSTHMLQDVAALSGHKIETAACGSCHSLALTTEGSVYSWGLNLKGQLGLGHYDAVSEPVPVAALEPAAPLSKTAIGMALKSQRPLTRNSSLLRKGTTQHVKETEEGVHILLSQRSLSAEKKQLGHSMASKKSLHGDAENSDLSLEQSVAHPGNSSILSSRERVVEVACGALHSLIRTNSRRVLSAGYGALYALGHKEPTTLHSFRPISFFTEKNIAVIKIACGSNSSACVSQEGTAFLFGVVNYSAPDVPILFRMPSRIPFGGSDEASGKPNPLRNPRIKSNTSSYNSQKRATEISMGDGFTMILTEGGQVYSYGVNNHGQLGVGDYLPHEFCCKIEGLPTTITQIVCGNDHTLAIEKELVSRKDSCSSICNLYSWGSNAQGQLGDESLAGKTAIPHKLTAFSNAEVFKISCGSYSSFCLSYGNPTFPSSKAAQKSSGEGEEGKRKVMALQKEVANLKLELSIKNELQVQKIAPKTKPHLGSEKTKYKPFVEINFKDLIYEEKITEGGYGIQ